MIEITEEQIMQNWDNVDKPLVSIKCLAYNHEKYISQALDGFLMQKTNFPFEVIVHDDASTDRTADIIHEYESKFPKIIKPIYEAENQYSKPDGKLSKIMSKACTGKYIAHCEGDDYWIDENKLQIQVNFLESNSDFVLCFHNVKIFDETKQKLFDDFITRDVSAITDIYELSKGNYIHTPSVMHINDSRIEDLFHKLIPIEAGDYPKWMLLSQYGKIRKYSECMAVYRYGNGTWSSTSFVSRLLSMIKICAKLSVIIEDEKAKEILESQIVEKSEELINYSESILNSNSWKLTKPLRILNKLLKFHIFSK